MTEHKKYATPGAMRTALEERINRTARETRRDVQRLRRLVAFDRLLARFFSHNQFGSFVLKGGYAIELRLHKARTTKDIDLCISGSIRHIPNGILLKAFSKTSGTQIFHFKR